MASTAPGGAQQCPVIDLVELTASLRGVIAEAALHGQRLGTIAQIGRRGMGVDVLDLARIQSGIPECIGHREACAFAVFRRCGDVMSIAAHAEAHEFGIDARAARLGMLVLFQQSAHRHRPTARSRRDHGPTAGLRACGSSLRVDSARAWQKLPRPSGVVAISPAPAIITSASPY